MWFFECFLKKEMYPLTFDLHLRMYSSTSTFSYSLENPFDDEKFRKNDAKIFMTHADWMIRSDQRAYPCWILPTEYSSKMSSSHTYFLVRMRSRFRDTRTLSYALRITHPKGYQDFVAPAPSAMPSGSHIQNGNQDFVAPAPIASPTVSRIRKGIKISKHPHLLHRPSYHASVHWIKIIIRITRIDCIAVKHIVCLVNCQEIWSIFIWNMKNITEISRKITQTIRAIINNEQRNE